ncbi:5-formyltetrahydrofolate cyclo-ligase [Erythrobacter sp. Alg231-14]|uniref:5-formyltetrahydrofolate cyclo-ligase n=1 Tax=Erythrobacter sp. Alg231-14 TaxID=1922225 RepID=UPI000D5518D4
MDTPPTPSKSELRKSLLAARREHVLEQPSSIQALLFNRPPAPLAAKIGQDAVIGLYHATRFEASARGYARFFQDAGHTVALPYFASDDATMSFRAHTDPYDESDLVSGSYGLKQPGFDAEPVTPDVVFVPLVGFTDNLDRLGQGGGHYDRWLAEHPGRIAIGLAWDAQLTDTLPVEPHDIALDAVVTPTRIYGLK